MGGPYKQSWSREVRQRDLRIIREDELKLNSKFSSGERWENMFPSLGMGYTEAFFM